MVATGGAPGVWRGLSVTSDWKGRARTEGWAWSARPVGAVRALPGGAAGRVVEDKVKRDNQALMNVTKHLGQEAVT